MEDLFITKIHINKVRHLENIDICLSENGKKHLILTGKNGSGKTSLLNALNESFSNMTSELYEDHNISYYSSDGSDGNLEAYVHNFIDGCNVYFPATRLLDLDMPQVIETINLDSAAARKSKMFVKYMLYLNYQKMSAITNNEPIVAEQITDWFTNFVSLLRDIYNSPELELKHDTQNLSFKITMPDREPFGLNEMADGYSSFLNIVMELMMSMENQTSITYDLPGIVLIDEIETHLHVELQMRVLPFLTKMFPRIQFIVTTHSPFVITSVSNAVVYDLEKQVAVEDMSAYSYEAVIEHYYDVNMYSMEANKQFEIYKSLVDKENRSPNEMEQLVNAITYLKQIPAGAAEELVYSFREMEVQRRQRANGQAQ